MLGLRDRAEHNVWSTIGGRLRCAPFAPVNVLYSYLRSLRPYQMRAGNDRALSQIDVFDLGLRLHGSLAFLVWKSVYITKQVGDRREGTGQGGATAGEYRWIDLPRVWGAWPAGDVPEGSCWLPAGTSIRTSRIGMTHKAV